jgi:hypothetical protein
MRASKTLMCLASLKHQKHTLPMAMPTVDKSMENMQTLQNNGADNFAGIFESFF